MTIHGHEAWDEYSSLRRIIFTDQTRLPSTECALAWYVVVVIVVVRVLREFRYVAVSNDWTRCRTATMLHFRTTSLRFLGSRSSRVNTRRYASQRPSHHRKPPNFLALVAILGAGFGAFALVSQQQAADPVSIRKGNQFSKAGVTPTPEGMADQQTSQAKLKKGGPTPTFDSTKITVLCEPPSTHL